MKAKHALVLLVLGYCLNFIGGLFKLEHWEYADEILIVATVCIIIGLILLLLKLLAHPKAKEFLNR
jgi:hypothetical protein